MKRKGSMAGVPGAREREGGAKLIGPQFTVNTSFCRVDIGSVHTGK